LCINYCFKYQNEVPEIAGELTIFTVPVDLIFMNGKEMHRQGRFIDVTFGYDVSNISFNCGKTA
jgi:hypothetical protein